jgi:chromosome segregation ATPase
MGFPPAPPRGHVPAPPPGQSREDEAKKEMEEKIRELEKKLDKEHEQVLMANLKSQEEKEVAARVETSIKDIQDKLRRDRREAQSEEVRLKLEARITELENRLVQERETWVSTLKNQMTQREGQDKEIETHFTMRIQEMERRWLEEKAHWQSAVTQKSEEARKLTERLEQLEPVSSELQTTQHDKEKLEERVRELSEEKANLQAKVNGASERERDFFQIKADLTTVREQLRMTQEKYEKEVPSIRSAAKEREQRLLADNERLQSELGSVTRRIRAEYEAEIRRIRAESEGELKKARAQADLAGAALQRMRAVGSALEKQVASLRAQATEAKQLKEEMKQVNDRYKAEFIVLQRKWQDREVELRKKAEDEYNKKLETEKAKIKLRAQEEIQNRVVSVQEQLRKEMAGELLEKERVLRTEMERQVTDRSQKVRSELDDMRHKVEAELKHKTEEYAKKDLHWQERIIAAETESAGLKTALDDLKARFSREEERGRTASGEKADLEKTLSGLYEKVRMQQAAIDESERKWKEEGARARDVSLERDSLVQGQAAFEERIADGRRSMEALEAKIEKMETANNVLQNDKVELQETVAKVEAEHSRQMETWRRKLDLMRRDFESRIRSVESDRAKALRELSEKKDPEEGGAKAGSIMDKVMGVFGKKKPEDPSEPPAPPVPGNF